MPKARDILIKMQKNQSWKIKWITY
jgi:hypothetical protein